MNQDLTSGITGIDLIDEKEIANGYTIQVYHITYGRARLAIGKTGENFYDSVW